MLTLYSKWSIVVLVCDGLILTKKGVELVFEVVAFVFVVVWLMVVEIVVELVFEVVAFVFVVVVVGLLV